MSKCKEYLSIDLYVNNIRRNRYHIRFFYVRNMTEASLLRRQSVKDVKILYHRLRFLRGEEVWLEA